MLAKDVLSLRPEGNRVLAGKTSVPMWAWG